MQMNTVNKIQFGQLNDKRFYFPNGIVSLPFGHFLFDEMRKKKLKIETSIFKLRTESGNL